MSKRLLVAVAHPDDESFGLGSSVARYVAEGVEVYLICATNGDVGTIDPKYMNGHDSVASVRLAELACANQVLGFKEMILFGYRDSGMMGSADNAHSGSLWQAPLEEVTGRIVEVIRRVRPQVVITFDPFGGYGHPDHIKMNQATLAAWELLRNEPACPRKLYYPVFPRLMVRIGVMLMRLRGGDPRRFGANKDIDLQAVLEATPPTHTRINVAPYFEIGQQAARCHASQNPPGVGNGILSLLARLASRSAAFARVEPSPKNGEPLERDLFAGVE